MSLPPPEQRPYPVSHAVWTVPNVISFVRILLIAVFGGLFIGEQDVAAIIVLACAGFSDFLDGFLARRWNQVTALGRLLDPAADRLLTLVVVLGLAIRDVIPWWLVIILMARDAMVGTALLYGRSRKIRSPHVTFVGKAATFCLYITLPLAYVGYEVATWLNVLAIVLSLGAAVLYWISGVGYVQDIRHRAAAARRARPAADGPRMEATIRDSEEAS
ncbi:CDP-alcohol phosphatidyltransferase family protein [Demequina sp. NBRC 110057]|uniref:CDP-alcohol phosphatidyltransferase family protein n=1 Tax=Demequina sp. NBRC 110057 TaxID=1570346 RepID=UPI0013566F5D|nr:CDP-alcohol phosphatidyltransferase family protein [Demequina sp. NBRC 110057]